MRLLTHSVPWLHSAIAVSVLVLTIEPCDAVIVQTELSFRGTIGSPGVPNASGDGFVIPPSDFPPDTNGAVGPEHIVELNKKEFRVYDKATGAFLDAQLLDDFWNAALPSGAQVEGQPRAPDGVNKAFDPRVLYDSLSGRWFAVSVGSEHRLPGPKETENTLLIAVSNTSDPLQGWVANKFSLRMPGQSDVWGDFPRLGINSRNVTVALNNLDLATNNNTDTQTIVVFPKDEAIDGDIVHFLSGNRHVNLGIGDAPRAAQPLVSMEPLIAIGTVSVDGATLIGTGLTSHNAERVDIVGTILLPKRQILPVAQVTAVSSVQAVAESKGETPGSVIEVNVGPLSLNPPAFESSVIFQNGIIWAARDVRDTRAPMHRAVQVLKIDAATNSVLQSDIIRDPNPNVNANRSYYYPSIAVNEAGYVFVGFSGSSRQDFIGAYGVVGHTVNGVTTYGDVFTIKAGEAPYERLDSYSAPGGPRNRWGDYSATVVDPSDDNVFWTFQEYAFLNKGGFFGNVIENSYATRIASYRIIELVATQVGKTWTQVEVGPLAPIDEAQFHFSKPVGYVAVDGTIQQAGGRSARLPLDGTVGTDESFFLSFQGDPKNFLVPGGLQGFLGGKVVPDALDTVGVPPVVRFDPATGEFFADFFNPYDFMLHVDNVELYVNNDMNNLNPRDLASPTGQQVEGYPTTFELWPGQTYRLSFGDLATQDHTYVLALAAYSRADEPDVTFRVATAAVPEPSTFVLLGIATLVFVAYAWRGKR